MTWLWAPGTSVHVGDDSYLWFELCLDGFELYPEHIEHQVLGEPSEALAGEVDCVGWIDMWESDLPLSTEGRYLHWALTHGVAPDQPFLLRFGEPTYYAGGWAGSEPIDPDVDYDVELVHVGPLHVDVGVERWRKTLRKMGEAKRWHAMRKRELHLARVTRVEDMYVESTSYFVPGQSWCEMEMPRGERLRLVSKYRPSDGYGGGYAHLAYGESHEGDLGKAWVALAEATIAAGIDLDESRLRALPRRRGGL